MNIYLPSQKPETGVIVCGARARARVCHLVSGQIGMLQVSNSSK